MGVRRRGREYALQMLYAMDVTGYAPEPWHLRYVGPEIAAAMREGGYTTLEEFFGLPAAPTYAPVG